MRQFGWQWVGLPIAVMWWRVIDAFNGVGFICYVVNTKRRGWVVIRRNIVL